MYFFLFNRTTLQVFVAYLTGALYVYPFWFYNRVWQVVKTTTIIFTKNDCRGFNKLLKPRQSLLVKMIVGVLTTCHTQL